MSRAPRIILFAVSGLVGLPVLVAAALLLLVDANVYKARLEATATAALGMDVSIGGRLGISLFPGLLVTLENVHIRNRGADIAFAKQASFAIDLVPLLKREVRIQTVELRQPTITVETDREGRFSFEKTEAGEGTVPDLDWPNVSLSDATFVYTDKRFGQAFQAGDCRLDVQRLRLSGGKRSDLMSGLSFAAELACAEVRSDGFTVSELRFSANAKNGVFDLQPVTTRVFGTQGSGSIQADYSGAAPVYHVRYSLSQFPIEEVFRTMSPQKIAAGRMDFSANLSTQGRTAKEMRQTLKGQISLRGKNLTLSSRDLDREFARFESSQNFNLVDVAALFFAGPLGLVVTKGYNFASIFQESGGSSEIPTLVSDWNVERGVAHAHDVAMATKENRVALKGGLDFVNDHFDDVTVALIDAKGCAKARQTIRGTFRNPVVESPTLLTSLSGPALTLLKKARELLLGEQCDVFYAGSVAAPK